MGCTGCQKKENKIKKMRRKKEEFNVKRKRIKKFYATYLGKQKHLKVRPVIGKVIPGKEYEVPESLANALQPLKDWKVITKYSYEMATD